MKWIIALNETSIINPKGANYEMMARVAVYSAKVNAPSLDPILIWNGNETEFTKSMLQMGVQVIYHRLSFQDAIESTTSRTAQWQHTAKGAMLRLDIPSIFKDVDELVLYTDVDVMFLDDPVKYAFRTETFAFSSEFQFDNFKDINTGVMLLNVQAARSTFPLFIDWVVENLEWIPDYDQGAIKAYFNGRWDRLSQRMNWKPYWNVGNDPIVVHFHGPKPLDFDPISLNPLFSFDNSHIYYRLLKLGDLGYRHYLKQWLSLAHDSFA